MARYSFGKSPARPTKSKASDIYINQTAANQWYTLLNVINGRGKLGRISMVSGANNSSQEIKVEIDGNSEILGLPSGSADNVARGFMHDAGGGHRGLDYFFDVEFYQNLKIEVRLKNGVTAYACASVDYSLE